MAWARPKVRSRSGLTVASYPGGATVRSILVVTPVKLSLIDPAWRLIFVTSPRIVAALPFMEVALVLIDDAFFWIPPTELSTSAAKASIFDRSPSRGLTDFRMEAAS
jgi:hypothetical protein